MSFQGTLNGFVQNTVTDGHLAALPGNIASIVTPRLIDGFPAEAQLTIGTGVVQGTAIGVVANQPNNLQAPYQVTNVDAGTVAADFVGIVVRESSSKNDAAGDPIVEIHDMANVMRKGRIYVAANQAIAAGDPVFLIIQDTTVHGFQIGSFSNVALGIDTVPLTTATFWKAAAVNTVASIELNVL